MARAREQRDNMLKIRRQRSADEVHRVIEVVRTTQLRNNLKLIDQRTVLEDRASGYEVD